jgi:hypothetical protein
MRILLALAASMMLATETAAIAQGAPPRLNEPMVKGQPIDHCRH